MEEAAGKCSSSQKPWALWGLCSVVGLDYKFPNIAVGPKDPFDSRVKMSLDIENENHINFITMQISFKDDKLVDFGS